VVDELTVGAFFFADKLHAMPRRDRISAFKRLAGFGVNTVLIESEVYDDEVIADAHASGLRFWGGIACFLAQGEDILERQPELRPILSNGVPRPPLEWYNGVIPTVESHRQERLSEVSRIVGAHQVDGFVLDFVRWPLHWEVELRVGHPPPLDSSFDRPTLEMFRDAKGVAVPVDDPVAASTWIMQNAPMEWISFKCDVITSFVTATRERLRAVGDRQLPLALCIVPLSPEWVGQRIEDLSAVADVICPMSYHPALYRSPKWVARNVADFVSVSRAPVVPLLQSDTDGEAVGADLGPPVADDDLARIVEESLVAGARGVGIFTGSDLLRGGRGDALRRGLG
jgi:hypothetical protein